MNPLSGSIAVARSTARASGLCWNAAALLAKATSLKPSNGSYEAYPRLAGLSRQYAQKICRMHGLRVEVRGTAPAHAAVYAANHLGYIDPLLVISQAPMLAISKMEIAGWPLLGTAMNASGILFVKRGDVFSGVRLLRKAIRLVRAGVSILNFPEGSTTDGTTLLPFHRGIFGIARLAHVPVVPVRIAYRSSSLTWYGDMTFFPHYLKTSARKITDVRLTFCDPVPAGEFPTAEALAEHCRGIINNGEEFIF